MIKVLVVDDSLFMRTLVSDMLNSDPEIEVIDTASNGEKAAKKIPKIKPDCITLDLAMPGWDGLTTLRHIMEECPTPVVILSAHSKQDADITIECLNAGAVSFVLKPSGELSLDIKDVKHQLLVEVKAAARVNLRSFKVLAEKRPKKPRRRLIAHDKIIVMGASTGGPQTLEAIVSSLPADFSAPVIIVQHVPSRFFSESLAEHLNKVSDLEVKVAENNEIIQAGRVYLVPCGSHMTLKPQKTSFKDQESKIEDVIICLGEEEPDILSPSVDLIMKSVAQTYNGNTIGIILSGMGHDGREGMRAIKESGGKTIVQDESSLIFGMPKAVIEAGYADKVLPTYEIAEEMAELVER